MFKSIRPVHTRDASLQKIGPYIVPSVTELTFPPAIAFFVPPLHDFFKLCGSVTVKTSKSFDVVKC